MIQFILTTIPILNNVTMAYHKECYEYRTISIYHEYTTCINFIVVYWATLKYFRFFAP